MQLNLKASHYKMHNPIYEALKEVFPNQKIMVGSTQAWIGTKRHEIEQYNALQISEDVLLAQTLDFGEGVVKILSIN